VFLSFRSNYNYITTKNATIILTSKIVLQTTPLPTTTPPKRLLLQNIDPNTFYIKLPFTVKKPVNYYNTSSIKKVKKSRLQKTITARYTESEYISLFTITKI